MFTRDYAKVEDGKVVLRSIVQFEHDPEPVAVVSQWWPPSAAQERVPVAAWEEWCKDAEEITERVFVILMAALSE